MLKVLTALAFLSVSVQAQVTGHPIGAAAELASPVVQWNRNLSEILRTPGAQPATIHSTRTYAIMHAAIYDAVNSIDGTHHSYEVRVQGLLPDTSRDAAAASAAHEVLVAFYPRSQPISERMK